MPEDRRHSGVVARAQGERMSFSCRRVVFNLKVLVIQFERRESEGELRELSPGEGRTPFKSAC